MGAYGPVSRGSGDMSTAELKGERGRYSPSSDSVCSLTCLVSSLVT